MENPVNHGNQIISVSQSGHVTYSNGTYQACVSQDGNGGGTLGHINSMSHAGQFTGFMSSPGLAQMSLMSAPTSQMHLINPATGHYTSVSSAVGGQMGQMHNLMHGSMHPLTAMNHQMGSINQMTMLNPANLQSLGQNGQPSQLLMAPQVNNSLYTVLQTIDTSNQGIQLPQQIQLATSCAPTSTSQMPSTQPQQQQHHQQQSHQQTQQQSHQQTQQQSHQQQQVQQQQVVQQQIQPQQSLQHVPQQMVVVANSIAPISVALAVSPPTTIQQQQTPAPCLPDNGTHVSGPSTTSCDTPKVQIDSAPTKHYDPETGTTTFPCRICGKSFGSSEYLMRHEKRHLGDKPFQCNVCQKHFANLYSLKIHLRSHTGERPYKCSVCERGFTQLVHCQKHERVHLRIKAFTCNICQSSHASLASLRTHKKQVHKGARRGRPPGSGATNPAIIVTTSSATIVPTSTKPPASRLAAITKVFKAKFSGLPRLTLAKPKEEGEVDPNNPNPGQSGTSNEVLSGDQQEQTSVKKDVESIVGGGEGSEMGQSLECPQCKKVFTHVNHLKRHERVHLGVKPFQCVICRKYFAHAYSLKIHQRCHTGEKPFSCQICGRRFAQLTHCQTHQKIHTRDQEFRCSVCPSTFSNPITLKIHLRRHTQTTTTHACRVCRLTFNTALNLKVHMTTHIGKNAGAQGFNCHVCGKRFAQMGHLTRHEKKHEEQSMVLPSVPNPDGTEVQLLNKKPHLCTTCGKAFAHAAHLIKHERTHTGEKPFVCQICQKAFAQNFSLKRHEQSHIMELATKQEVQDPSLAGPTQSGLVGQGMDTNTIVKSSPSNTKLACPTCGKLFVRHTALLQHQRVHSGEKPPCVCDQCGKAFIQPSALKRHILTHTGQKPYDCLHCHKLFATPTSLKTHTKLHTDGADTYSCNICNKSFSNLGNLTRHQRAFICIKKQLETTT